MILALPVILAALARVGAGLAARAGATGVARSLIGMARTAGAGVARRAAARAAAQAAASRGASAGVTAASEGAAAPQFGHGMHAWVDAPGTGARVLENTTLRNARSLFQAIYGQTPPAGATSAAAAAAPGSQAAAAAQTAEQAAAAVATPSTAAAPAPPGPAMPTSAGPPPVPPGATPPSNPRPQSLLDRTLDAWRQARATYDQARQRFTPISEQVANLTLDQRYQRLQAAGKLPAPGSFASAGPPTREQQVIHGEAEEERQRQEDIANSRHAQVRQAAWSAGKKSLAGALAMTNPAKMATAPIWLYGVIKGFELLGRTISDTNRDLRQFDSRIADSFARLDYAQLRSRQKVAQATSGSASFLNDQLAALTRELQPMRNTLGTLLNVVGGNLVSAARSMNTLLTPIVKSLEKIAKVAEWWYGTGQSEEGQAALRDFLRTQRDGKFSMPNNKRPGEP